MAEEKATVAQVLFEVEEEAGRAFVRVQQQYVPGVPALRYGSLRFDLNEGVGRDEAERIASLLNEKVHSIAYAGEDTAEEPSGLGG